MKSTSLLFVIYFIGSLLCRPVATADEKENVILAPDFVETAEGEIPDGWEGSESLSVRKDGKLAWIEPTTKGIHEMRSPKFSVPQDFHMEFTADISYSFGDSGLRVQFESQGKESVNLGIAASWHDEWTIRLADTSAKVDVTLDKPVRVEVVRENRVYKVLVEGKVVIAKRITPLQEFSRVRIALSGPKTTEGRGVSRLHSLKIMN